MQKEFNDIIKDIITNEEFMKLQGEVHHSTTRFNHSLRVAYEVYNKLKDNNQNYVDATRAALLHDFFFDDDLSSSQSDRLNNHPLIALENAKKYFDINELQENIILSHMYPLSYCLPRFKESWIVSLMDKKVTILEFKRYGFKKSYNNNFKRKRA
ncbi:MAG: hypothetical protein E7159_01055 [Firmicutes bacterium]|nr:hypothetical protein [Bacillota bacterium]